MHSTERGRGDLDPLIHLARMKEDAKQKDRMLGVAHAFNAGCP